MFKKKEFRPFSQKDIITYYPQTLAMACFTIPIVAALFELSLEVLLLLPQMLIIFPFAIILMLIPYIISLAVIKFIFRTTSPIAYALMGTACSASLFLIKPTSFLNIDRHFSFFSMFFVAGAISGIFYWWLEYGRKKLLKNSTQV